MVSEQTNAIISRISLRDASLSLFLSHLINKTVLFGQKEIPKLYSLISAGVFNVHWVTNFPDLFFMNAPDRLFIFILGIGQYTSFLENKKVNRVLYSMLAFLVFFCYTRTWEEKVG